MRTSALLACLLVAAAPAPSSAGPVTTVIRTHGPLRLADDPETLPPGCGFATFEEGAALTCPGPETVELTVVLAGYEPRHLALEAGGPEVDLRDDGWRPTPVTIRAEPAARVRGAILVWIEDGELRTTWLDRGSGPGPRVAPGEPYTAAVVGPHTAPVVASGIRDPKREPRTVRLEEGASAAVVCRDPWTGLPAGECRVEMGVLLDLLEGLGGGRLLARGEVRPLDPIHLLRFPDTLREGRTLRIQASLPDGSSAHAEVDPTVPLVELVLETPRILHVNVTGREEGDPVGGASVVVSRVLEEGLLRLVETTTDPTGEAVIPVVPGDYRIEASAPGYAPVREEIRIGRRDRDLGLRMEAATLLEGVVVDSRGAPLPDAVVTALTPSFQFESRHNFVRTDASGLFQVTLPGPGPWTLVARREGYLGDPVDVGPATDWVTLVLDPRCEVTLFPLEPDGTPVTGGRLALVAAGGREVVPAEPSGAPGRYRAALTPGAWILVSEALGLRAILEVPDPCVGFQASVVLGPPGG